MRVLLSLINDILDFSKIEAGKLALESIHLKLRDLVEGTVRMMAEEAAKKGLELGCLVFSDVPDNVRGDPNRLRQVLLNLLSNAIKFTEHGEIVVRVSSVVAESTRVTLRFAVSDTGVGISSAAQAMLFKPFIQADGSTTRKYGGTGLGLSITKRIIDLMGGTLGVESKVGKGSTFWFEVPFEEDVAESGVEGTREPSPSVCDPDIHDGRSLLTTNTERQVRVLVVEDKEVNQIVLTSMLRRPGFRLDIASNGREAIEAVRDVCYDIVFMDCHMPEVDGWEATFQIREMERDMKNTIIVAITADALAGDKERCFAAGMDDYISKPVKLAEINRVLAKWIPVSQTAPSEPAPETRDAGPDPTVLDYARIQELRAVGGEDDAEVLSKTVSSYIEDTPSQIAELRQALETSDWHLIEMISHSLRGTSANVGAVEIVRHSRTLEKSVRVLEPLQIRVIINNIESEFERVRPLLEEELSEGFFWKKPQREEKI